MNIKDSPDYSSGYSIEGDVEHPYTEYGGKTGFRPKDEGRGPLAKGIQRVLRFVFMLLAALGLFVYTDAERLLIFSLYAGYYLLLFAACAVLTLLFSHGGENKPLQLWFTASLFPAYLTCMLMSLTLFENFSAFLKAVGYFVFLIPLFFFLDWRVSGHSSLPFLLLLPLAFCGTRLPKVFLFTDAVPRSLFLATGILLLLPIVNACVSSLKELRSWTK